MFQSRQPVFVKLLQHAFRVSDCPWLTGTQKYHVETCIKCLADIGKVVQGLIKGLSNLSFVSFLKILTLSSSMKRGIKFWISEKRFCLQTKNFIIIIKVFSLEMVYQLVDQVTKSISSNWFPLCLSTVQLYVLKIGLEAL